LLSLGNWRFSIALFVPSFTEPVFLNVYGAQESTQRNEFPPAYAAMRAGTITLFPFGS
jgi:hypothetical protein